MDQDRDRPFSNEERAFLECVAAKLPAEAGERLHRDVQIARVTPEGDYLLVDLPDRETPEYRGHRNLPFEGKMRAADGGAMSVLVNMDQDRLLAVEFIYWESASSAAPEWSTLTIVPEPPMRVFEG